jgi:hypothetical protein
MGFIFMKKISLIALFWVGIYLLVAVVLFLLFIEEAPFRKKPKLQQLREVFSVGWNFFTKDPRNDITQIYYFDEKTVKWVEIGQSGRIIERTTRITDALQMDIYNYANQAADSIWHLYHNQYELLKDSKISYPSNNYFSANNSPGRWLSKSYIKKKYGSFFMVVVSNKMPWAWLKTYSQKKMSCRAIVIKI